MGLGEGSGAWLDFDQTIFVGDYMNLHMYQNSELHTLIIFKFIRLQNKMTKLKKLKMDHSAMWINESSFPNCPRTLRSQNSKGLVPSTIKVASKVFFGFKEQYKTQCHSDRKKDGILS